MKMFQPVIWSKGTFLTPQHLQAQDRFLETELHFRTEALSFCPWGFTRLSIDEKALATGEFDLLSASGLFPDGLAFHIPDADRKPQSIQVAPYFQKKPDTLDIFLAIPSYVDHGLNVTAPGGSTATRFVSDVANFQDENDGNGAEKPVRVARKRFRLLVEGESMEGSATMRIARIRKKSEQFELDPEFVPPMLNLHGSAYLQSLARGILRILAARVSELAETRRHRNQSVANFSIQDVSNFWLLYAINSHILPLRHLSDLDDAFADNVVHPEKLFTVLLSLAGALTTFPSGVKLTDLPLYDHNSLGDCFRELEQKLRILLQTVLPSNYVLLKLKSSRPWFFETPLDDDQYLTGTRFYLGITAELSEAELIENAPRFIKVSSPDNVEHIARHNIEGVSLTHVPEPPSPIPVKTNFQYFSLNQSGAAWTAIVKARNLAAHVPGKFVNPQLELLIVLPQR